MAELVLLPCISIIIMIIIMITVVFLVTARNARTPAGIPPNKLEIHANPLKCRILVQRMAAMNQAKHRQMETHREMDSGSFPSPSFPSFPFQRRTFIKICLSCVNCVETCPKINYGVLRHFCEIPICLPYNTIVMIIT